MARPSMPLIDYYSLESPVATEFRRLLHTFQRKGKEADLKSILFTSAITSEGKSTVASLMSITAAYKGHKTLLIDCDLRRPSVHRLFACERGKGMSEVLHNGDEVKSVVKKTSLDNLDIITAGKAVAHPTELFDSRIIGGLVHELKFYYDFVFVDTPPVIPVSDPMLLAQEMDGAVLIVKAGSTAREVAQRAADILSSSQINLLGVVLNNVKGSLPYYYDYSHYNYDYSQRHDSGKPIDNRNNPGAVRASKTDQSEKETDSPRKNRIPK
ncbi:MAG: CpsD/CapB family tyrosine-protein kinase [bacterium]|nr:CpsD/CapB family tyrosine-protein kinase [bacterium]